MNEKVRRGAHYLAHIGTSIRYIARCITEFPKFERFQPQPGEYAETENDETDVEPGEETFSRGDGQDNNSSSNVRDGEPYIESVPATE